MAGAEQAQRRMRHEADSRREAQEGMGTSRLFLLDGAQFCDPRFNRQTIICPAKPSANACYCQKILQRP
jgi:hypothetical protein